MEELERLYKEYSGSDAESIAEIPRAGSTRRYFRILREGKSVIGTYSPDVNETIAFTTFSAHFKKINVHVPEVLAVSQDQHFYLQKDLGSQSMHDLIVNREASLLSIESLDLYQKAIDQLTILQIQGHRGLDYSVCVPRSDFDKQSVLWDLNHFKYYFLKPSGLPFDEQKLEEAFDEFAIYLSSLPRESFMFRDFQTRNIMMKSGEPFLIDYQGGRRGPLQYDLASLIFESKTTLEEKDREYLIEVYLKSLGRFLEVDRDRFISDFYHVALVRIIQVLGSYGLRGMVEKKAVFLQSIPKGLENLHFLLEKSDAFILPSYLKKILYELVNISDRYQMQPAYYSGLTITVTSFSYRKPLPDDLSGNGGGFIYDCRFLNNPGRLAEFKDRNGLEFEVAEFLRENSDIEEFLDGIKTQLQKVLDVYVDRSFRNLSVSFGCTGGQHRSVYATHAIAEWLRKMQGIRVLESHREQGIEL